jgi:pyruvate/2-oxoglutarate dehydrogenase complex dihydrolipoamide acyltransferase (E2) component
VIELRLPQSAWDGVDPGVEALLDQWHVAEGDRVEAGQLLATVVLIKATIEIHSPAAGTLRILVPRESTFGREAVLGRVQPD